MKEYIEFRIIKEHAHLLFREDEGVNLGDSVKIIKIETSNPRFKEIGELQKKALLQHELFYSSYDYKREYSKEELQNAKFFRIIQTRLFEPAGEECGTIYDESTACPICGAGAQQKSPLRLKKSSIPHADISATIASGKEDIASENFVKLVRENKLTGIDFSPVINFRKEEQITNYYQIRPIHYLDFSKETVFGQNPFDLSGESPSFTWEYLKPDGTKVRKTYPPEIYKCPNGDNMGLDILSEAYIKSDQRLIGLDFFASRQTVGGRSGLIRPYHLLFCSNRMMKLIKEYKLKGFKFEVAHIVDE